MASKIILASASSRRKKLLEMLGLKFKVVRNNYKQEPDAELSPHELAKFLSLGKAQAIAEQHENSIIIAADTIVVLGSEIMNKPKTEIETKQILTKLAGKSHLVITGFTIFDTQRDAFISRSVETKVTLKKLTEEEINAYVKTKEPMNKVGAYTAQGLGALLVEKIEGDFYSVLGLPVAAVAETLREFGVHVLL